MSPKPLPILALLILLLSACKPKPIDIEVPQNPGALAISSMCHNGNAVYISAGYSINSLKKLLDTASVTELLQIPREMLVDSGLVTIRGYGCEPDTLRMISPGLFGRTDLQLVPGREYTLRATDLRKGCTITAITTYHPQPEIDTLYPQLIRSSSDTLVKLHLRLRGVRPGGRYAVSYNTPRHMRETATPLPFHAGALYSFAPKQLELLLAEATDTGILDRTITLQVSPTDTVFVQVGQIDQSYHNYLAAYKRTGALINQLTGEPINLPTNIVTGFGYFSLCQPARRVYNLAGH